MPQVIPDESSLRAWYGALVSEFVRHAPDAILGRLASNCGFALLPTQRDAWLAEIAILKEQLSGMEGTLYLEYTIPRMGRRIDAVFIHGPAIFALEFKVGEQSFDRSSIEQVWDYALDLKYFHEASHNAVIVPILIATEAPNLIPTPYVMDEDGVIRPIRTNTNRLREVLHGVLRQVKGEMIDSTRWAQAPYRPTPTIVEAARTLYAHHSVEAIARFDAGASNLTSTSRYIEVIVEEARINKRKCICFVTGVPGAGKTLVGLNIATQRRDECQSSHAVYLSGNGPLVAVLREALTRDEYQRQKTIGGKSRKGDIRKKVESFIQNIHHFRDDALVDQGAPSEHVVIFDEAQRAWNLRQTANFMKTKKNRPGFAQSEPEFLISYMDRHHDWAVIVCLVGGGQEINTGEAGIEAWLNAISHRFHDWWMYISPRLNDSEYAAGNALAIAKSHPKSFFDNSLHLGVSMRSFRSENVSHFVKALLDCDHQKARSALRAIADRYPIVITRNLEDAKKWIHRKARGSERFGLVASSKAMRLKPHAIDIRVAVDPVHYFLNDRDDTRSSYYLEDAATEFQVQGLELDWICVTWDADFRFDGSQWHFHDFRGSRWCRIINADNQNYLRNAYRVLLTRARQGMVIFVPPGNPLDATRPPDFYDTTFNYLKSIGLQEV